MTPSDDHPTGRALAVLGLSCLATIAALLTWGWASRDALRANPLRRNAFEERLIADATTWRARGGAPRGIVFFGDSFARHCPEKPVADALFDRLGARATSLDLSAPAMRPLEFYYLIDDALAGRPELAVIEVNLPFLNLEEPLWSGLSYLQLSRRLSLRRAFAVREALAADNLTLLDPAIYRLQDATDTLFVVNGLRGLVKEEVEVSGDAAARRLGLWLVPRRRRHLWHMREDAALARRVFAGDQTAHPMVPVLRELRVALAQAGVPVLFYVSPVNVAKLTELGVRQELGLPQRLETLRLAIGVPRRSWLDLHALHGADRFKDFAGHMTGPGCAEVAERIARALLARRLFLLELPAA